ncbi:hypothetical protein [Salipiger aestuarii]|uniref:hypothetical protein n=1 Tax=Salipiger aestuarii TaxID=568098 RepID=UPI0002D41E33|nr:hypothetical protein [Salipiger aestuarii]
MVFDTITLNGVLAGGSEITFAGLFDYVSTPGDLLMDIQFLSGARMSTTLSYNRNSNTEGGYRRLYALTAATPAIPRRIMET